MTHERQKAETAFPLNEGVPTHTGSSLLAAEAEEARYLKATDSALAEGSEKQSTEYAEALLVDIQAAIDLARTMPTPEGASLGAARNNPQAPE